MEKNYYQLLGVQKDASKEEITDAFKAIVESKYPKCFFEKDPAKRQEYTDLLYAYQILTDDEQRAEYDKTLKPVKNLKINKPKLKKWQAEGIKFALMTAASVAICLLAVSAASGKDKKPNSNSSSIASYSDAQQNIPEGNERLLTAENFEEKVQEIIASNNSKGLQTDESLVRSSLLLTNLSYFTDEELVKLIDEDINMETELQNLLYYVSQVENFNRITPLDKQVYLSDLAYDELDKAMLENLNSKCIELKTTLQDDSLSNEEKLKKIDEILPYIEKFVVGDGYVVLPDGNYRKQNLSSGAGILAESYCIVIGDEIHEENDLYNPNRGKYKPLIDTINANTNGLTYINELYSFTLPLPECLETGEPTNDSTSEKTM